MVIDIAVNTDLDLFIDGQGDIGTVSGFPQIEQSVLLDVFGETDDSIGSRMTGGNIGVLEQRIKEALQNDEQLSDIIRVNVTEINNERDEIRFEVYTVEDPTFEMGVTL
jgi:hypothetical protein